MRELSVSIEGSYLCLSGSLMPSCWAVMSSACISMAPSAPLAVALMSLLRWYFRRCPDLVLVPHSSSMMSLSAMLPAMSLMSFLRSLVSK